MSNYNVNLYFIIKEAYYFKDKKLLFDTLENVASSYLATKDERLFLFQPDEKEMKNL